MDNNLDKAILNTSINGLRSLLILFLSVGFLGIGMLKLVSMPDIIDYFKAWQLPLWSVYVIGAIELVLSVAVFYLPTRKQALIGLIVLMTGATGLHLYNQEYNYLIGPAVIILCSVILYLIEVKLEK